ncbi:hypothetical protein BH10ACT7_BH10ACT7_05570 [soil metagenome]
MSAATDLLEEIESLLAMIDTSYSESSAANDIYEGYVLALVVDAARRAGAEVEYRTVLGAVTNDLYFRTSPGLIYSKLHDYSHAVLRFSSCPPLEVHVGVMVQGRSGVLDECDVLVLPAKEAQVCRESSVSPRGPASIIAVECKFYASPVGIGLARAYHGLQADLGVRFPRFVTNVRSGSVEKYLTHLGREWENGVIPNTDESGYLIASFREAFKKYQAKNGSAT